MPHVTGLGHVGFDCTDLMKMRDFYSRVIGPQDHRRGPGARHLLPQRRPPPPSTTSWRWPRARSRAQETKNVQQVSFKVKSLDDVRQFHQRLRAEGMKIDRTVSHGIACSVYFFDPEDNRIELYYMTPYQVRQPLGEVIDLERPDAELLEISRNRSRPRWDRRAALQPPAR